MSIEVENLPSGDAPSPLKYDYFPTVWQLFLWRNQMFFPLEKLAKILDCPLATLQIEAARLGLKPRKNFAPWLSKGYQTIIRENWHLLNYQQLLELLDWPVEKLQKTLKEEDFLYTKLGNSKPDAPHLRFTELTFEQKIATERLKHIVEKDFPDCGLEYQEMPFGFLEKYGKDLPEVIKRQVHSDFSFHFIHAYSAGCGDFLREAEQIDPLPEALLKEYAARGVEGIWIHAVLYLLCPIDGMEEYSAGWEVRLKQLKILAERCRKYNLSLYLYLNEPRGMTYDFYKKRPQWAGADVPAKAMRSNCTSEKTVLQYMERASYEVFKTVPELGGAFLINMSENPTHCGSRALKHNCPACKNRDMADLIAECITALAHGIHRANPAAKVIAEDWAWQEWKNGETEFNNLAFKKRVIDKLPPDVYYMSISEWGKSICQGEVPYFVSDYSISQVGPGAEAVEMWKYAQKRGLKTAAKIQINNSWELGALPYIPVPYLIEEHLSNLSKLKIDGLMLSWTLGGYPGGNLELMHSTTEELARKKFPEDPEKVCRIWRNFSTAFRNFPFSIVAIYNAPVNFGPMCPMFLDKTNRKSTMIGFPFDDLTTWRHVYPETVFEEQFKKLTETWKTGLDELLAWRADSSEISELKTLAQAAYCHFKSCYWQIVFIRRRNCGDVKGMIQAIESDLTLVKSLMEIVAKDSRIGFESSNHYFYTLNDLGEKIINLNSLKAQLTQPD